MAIYHCSIKIISRAGGRSAISAAAYRSGERLYNEETGLTHDFTHKGGVIMNEIILPENAPAEYKDRELLWNEVQRAESRSDARFAREVEVALPVEMNREQQIECVRDYIRENFTSKGMIADWALHDKGDGNPHAHIMLTCREVNADRVWNTKTRSVFANTWHEYEKDGEIKKVPAYDPELPSYDPRDKEHTAQYRIPQLDENGEQKFRERAGKGKEMLWERVNIPSNDWNDRANAEKWRESWAAHCNRYLGPEHRIDHRSYERQGIDREPTIHEGFTARKIEAEGKIADRVQINREIKERNSLREQMKQLAKDLTEAIVGKAREIYERYKGFIGYIGHSEETRGDAGHPGGTPVRKRDTDERERELERTGRRIDELKRDTGEADKGLQGAIPEVQQTDSDIAATNQRLGELQELTRRKERERDERLKKLRERRSADTDGRNAGRDRKPESGERAAETDTQQLIRDIRAEISAERSAEREQEKITEDLAARADNSAVKRKDRELEQQRSATERSTEPERRGRYNGPSL